jgi:predicted Rdx family selenoprotein
LGDAFTLVKNSPDVSQRPVIDRMAWNLADWNADRVGAELKNVAWKAGARVLYNSGTGPCTPYSILFQVAASSALLLGSWLLRAAWMAQELITTFSTDIDEIALVVSRQSRINNDPKLSNIIWRQWGALACAGLSLTGLAKIKIAGVIRPPLSICRGLRRRSAMKACKRVFDYAAWPQA